MTFEVKEKTTLLTFLYEQMPKKEAKQYLTHQAIYINGRMKSQYDAPLKKGDIVTIKRFFLGLDIVYEDKDIIVINKEAGMLSIATNKSNDTLYRLVSEYVKLQNKHYKIFIIHRLDRETSGLIMFAKNERVKQLYQNDWNELVVKRGYLALVRGITEEQGTVQSYLKDTNCYVTSTQQKFGKLAITHYERLKVVRGNSLLAITIDTGRKNQIRVHMKDINHPIIGDQKYGNDKAERLYLHAHILMIKNPITHQLMTFTAKEPWHL